MIVSCPECSARFRVRAERVAGKKVSLRCARCKAVFAVSPDEESMRAENTQVLVAHADMNLCQTIGELLARDQIGFVAYHDGNAALDGMERHLPQVVVVDVALPGLYAFEVVEKVRSRPGLNEVKIILLSSVYNKTAYKRRPSSLYGADDYIEKHHLPDELVPKVRRLARLSTGASAPKKSGPQTAAAQVDDFDALNETIRHAEEQETAATDRQDAANKARRLARIIVSDIALYYQDKVEAGITDGSFYELLAAEVEEGRRLFAEKVDPSMLAQEDFLQHAFDDFIARRQKELAAQQEG